MPTGLSLDAAALRELRRGKTWTIEELAQRSGVADRTIRGLEAGTQGALAETVRCLAKALGAPVEALLAKPAPPDATPAGAAAGPKKPAPTALEALAAIEAEQGRTPTRETSRGELEVLGARWLQDVFTAYAVHEGVELALEAKVTQQRGLPPSEAALLGTKNGVGARFLVEREIAPDRPMSVTVHTASVEHTRELQTRLRDGAPAAMVVKLVVVPGDALEAGRGFAFFIPSERPRPWAFCVVSVEDRADPTPRKTRRR